MNIEHDQQLEHLRQQVRKLTSALNYIDMVVYKAAARYLRSPVPHGHLPIKTFIDLLAAEMRREFRDEVKKGNVRKEVITAAVEERIGNKIMELMPMIRSSVAAFVTIPVLITPKALGDRLDRTVMPFRAVCLRGEVSHGWGPTPMDAYRVVKTGIALHLIRAGTKEGVAKFLSTRRGNFVASFEKAKPFLDDRIEDFKIEVRIQEKDDGSETQDPPAPLHRPS